MKTIRLKEPRKLSLTETEAQFAPLAGKALVRAHRIGHIRAGDTTQYGNMILVSA